MNQVWEAVTSAETATCSSNSASQPNVVLADILDVDQIPFTASTALPTAQPDATEVASPAASAKCSNIS